MDYEHNYHHQCLSETALVLLSAGDLLVVAVATTTIHDNGVRGYRVFMVNRGSDRELDTTPSQCIWHIKTDSKHMPDTILPFLTHENNEPQ